MLSSTTTGFTPSVVPFFSVNVAPVANSSPLPLEDEALTLPVVSLVNAAPFDTVKVTPLAIVTVP